MKCSPRSFPSTSCTWCATASPSVLHQRQKAGHARPLGGHWPRLAQNKGIDRLIHAVAELRKTRSNVQLIWAGPDEGGRIAELRTLADQAGVGDSVKFTGRVEVVELERLLSRANLFVSGSSYEGYGLSTIEAMSSGTVPVVTRVGIHRGLRFLNGQSRIPRR